MREQALREFDLLYFTQDDDELDRVYFGRLANLASRSEYLHVRRRRPDILNHLAAVWRARSCPFLRRCTDIYLGSIDSLLFRHVVGNNPGAVVHGFDDGAGNISPDSVLHRDRYRKAALYGALLDAPGTQDVKRRITRYFTIYPGFDNIVPKEMTIPISPFAPGAHAGATGSMTFFIGQPFAEYLPRDQAQRLRDWLAAQKIDFYVVHPRETQPLLPGLPALDKRGELAEDAILAAAGEARPRIIAAMSSVLFNLSSAAADKVYLSLGTGAVEMEYRRLALQAGARVVRLSGESMHGPVFEPAALQGDESPL